MRKHLHDFPFPFFFFLVTYTQPQLVNSGFWKIGGEDTVERAVLGSREFNSWNFIRKPSKELDFTRGSVSTADSC